MKKVKCCYNCKSVLITPDVGFVLCKYGKENEVHRFPYINLDETSYDSICDKYKDIIDPEGVSNE